MATSPSRLFMVNSNAHVSENNNEYLTMRIQSEYFICKTLNHAHDVVNSMALARKSFLQTSDEFMIFSNEIP